MISLTVDLEEIYQDLWPNSDEKVHRYYGCKLPQGTFMGPLKKILEIFHRYHVCSTFFVSGEIGKSFPDVVREIFDCGHEIASHGYKHQDFTKAHIDEFEKMEINYRNFLAKVAGENPKGFRAPLWKINREVISMLKRLRYSYDSSVVPSIKIPGWFSHSRAPLHPYCPSEENLLKQSRCGDFYEVPIAVFPGIRLPAGGGWFLRNFGTNYVKASIKLLLRRRIPAILYVHPLDVDPNVPKFEGIPFHVTKNCGEYTLKAIINILKSFDCKKLTLRDVLEECCGANF